MRLRTLRALILAGALALAWSSSPATLAVVHASPTAPGFGASVHIFNAGMDQATIQAQLNAVAIAQVDNEFGPRRDAVLFEPGIYGSKEHPLIFQVGYYTSVAGLGLSPGDVVINGAIDVFNHCTPGSCIALDNFWRSLSNLTINFSPYPPGDDADLRARVSGPVRRWMR